MLNGMNFNFELAGGREGGLRASGEGGVKKPPSTSFSTLISLFCLICFSNFSPPSLPPISTSMSPAWSEQQITIKVVSAENGNWEEKEFFLLLLLRQQRLVFFGKTRNRQKCCARADEWTNEWMNEQMNEWNRFDQLSTRGSFSDHFFTSKVGLSENYSATKTKFMKHFRRRRRYRVIQRPIFVRPAN